MLPSLPCLVVVERSLGSPVHLAGSMDIVPQPCSDLLFAGSADCFPCCSTGCTCGESMCCLTLGFELVALVEAIVPSTCDGNAVRHVPDLRVGVPRSGRRRERELRLIVPAQVTRSPPTSGYSSGSAVLAFARWLTAPDCVMVGASLVPVRVHSAGHAPHETSAKDIVEPPG